MIFSGDSGYISYKSHILQLFMCPHSEKKSGDMYPLSGDRQTSP